MNDAQVMQAPEIPVGNIPDSKWEREYREFLRLTPTLLQSSRGKFVAVHEGRVVGSGNDQIEVALNAYQQFGYQPIFVGEVTEDASTPLRIALPRIIRAAGQ